MIKDKVSCRTTEPYFRTTERSPFLFFTRSLFVLRRIGEQMIWVAFSTWDSSIAFEVQVLRENLLVLHVNICHMDILVP